MKTFQNFCLRQFIFWNEWQQIHKDRIVAMNGGLRLSVLLLFDHFVECGFVTFWDCRGRSRPQSYVCPRNTKLVYYSLQLEIEQWFMKSLEPTKGIFRLFETVVNLSSLPRKRIKSTWKHCKTMCHCIKKVNYPTPRKNGTISAHYFSEHEPRKIETASSCWTFYQVFRMYSSEPNILI